MIFTLLLAALLTQSEQALVRSIDAHEADAIALLERVVNINSGTQNHAGVREVGRIFRAELDALGFHTEWVDQAEVRRAGHLVAHRPGPGPRILLIGHLDTVFEPDSPFQKFERIDAKTARGPGVTDMKGGNVIIIHALKALHATGQLANMHVAVVMTGDEEDTGLPLFKAREALIAAAKGARYAIGFENGDGRPDHAIVARRGTTEWKLTVHGRTGHGSQIFQKEFGIGAIFEVARLLNAMREKLMGQPHLTLNAGAIVGGTSVEMDVAQARGTASGKTNVIPAQVVVTGDLRALTVEQFRSARAAMLAVVATTAPPLRAELHFEEGYPPLAPSAGNDQLLTLYDKASRDLGFGAVSAVSPDKAGAADVAYVAGEVPAIIDAAGLKGTGDHSPNETADLSTLGMQIKRAAVLLSRLAASAQQP